MKNNKVDENIIVSFIIPIYNSEFTIKKMLDSMKPCSGFCEVICVDDGSVDNTENVIKEYICSNADMHIVYLKQSNAGPSAARNRGKTQALGKYIMFADSDDFYGNGLYQFVELLSDCESNICVFPFYRDGKSVGISKNGNVPMDYFLKYGYEIDDLYIHALWNKAYRRDLLLNRDFDEMIRLGEDALFNLDLFKSENDIQLYKDSIYNYNIVGDSLSHKNKSINLVGNSYEKIIQHIQPLVEYYHLDNALVLNYVIGLVNEYVTKRNVSAEDRKYLLKWLKKYKEMINHKKVGKFYGVLSCLLSFNLFHFSLLFCELKRMINGLKH